MEAEKKEIMDLVEKIFKAKYTGHLVLNFFKGKPGVIDVKKTYKFKDIKKIDLA